MHKWDLTISKLYIKFGDRLKLDRNYYRETNNIVITLDTIYKTNNFLTFMVIYNFIHS
ncbi:hypothetical protein C8N37_105201 [Sphingobacterium faecium]|nr:hypothetical protein C8N37_105201 [Sphingobacterium faecium]